MSRLVLGVAAALLIAIPAAQAQINNMGMGNGGHGYGGINSIGGFNSGAGYTGPTGSYFYPGFGWSSRPLGGGYYGQGTTGYSYGNGYVAPVYAAPVAVPGLTGYFRFGNASINYWRGPSGIYYPWFAGGGYVQQQPVYVVEQGQTQPSQPPLSSMFTDMENYLDDSQKKGKLSQTDYQRLFRRLQDVRSKFDHQRSAAGGALDSTDEESIRRDVANLGGEIARSIKPIQTP